MATISFKEPHSLAMRLWHWFNFILIAALLVTVLILDTFLNKQHGVAVLKSFSIAGLTDDVALQIVKSLRSSVWQWHRYIGYALFLTFLFRVIIEIYTAPSKRLGVKIKEAANNFKIDRNNSLVKHFMLVKISYVVFYLILLVTVLTGLLLSFYTSLGISTSAANTIKDFHGTLMYFTLGFILLHLAGVIHEEIKGTKGIVSDMINGGIK